MKNKETLEEVADKYFPLAEKIGGEIYTAYKAFIAGAKCQAERMYSEEEMLLAFETGRNYQLTGENNFKELIEQLKKK